MRRYRSALCRIAALLACAALLILPAAAFQGEEETGSLYGYLPQEAETLVGQSKTESGYDLNKGISALMAEAFSELGGILQYGLRSAVKLLAVCLLCAAAALLIGDQNALGQRSVNMGAVLAVVTLGTLEVNAGVHMASALLHELDVFGKALMMAMTAAGTAAGTPGTSIARQSAALLFGNLTITLFLKVFVPLIYMALALRTVGILSGNPFFNRGSAFIRNAVGIAIRTLLTLYLAYLSIMGLVGAAADTLAKKAVQTTVSTVIPVVGGVLSEAADSIFAGSAVIKSTLGVFGVISILSCALLPLLSTGAAYLMLRFSAAVSSAAADHDGVQAVDAVADAMSSIFALCAAAVTILLITVILCMRTSI